MPTKNRRARGRSKEELGAATGAKNRAGGGDATTKAKSVVSPTLLGACCAIVVIAALVACFLAGSDSRISPVDRIQSRSDADGVDEEAAQMNMVPAGVGTSVREAGASFTLLPPVETQPGVHRFQVPVQPMRKPRYVVDAEVITVENFLPLHVAERWRDRMELYWSAIDQESSKYSDGRMDYLNDLDPTNTSGWLYTTNEGNAKFRGNKNVLDRIERAEKARRAGQFSYSKWELAPSHDLVQEIKAQLESTETRSKVQGLVGSKPLAGVMADIFVTQYTTGNFLTEHNDAFSGTWAIVLSLASGPEWEQGHGGELEFRCKAQPGDDFRGADPNMCRTLAPKFNSAVLFRTNNPAIGPPHSVLPVSAAAGVAGFKRFGVTAWWTEVDEVLSEEFIRENKKMRGKLVLNEKDVDLLE